MDIHAAPKAAAGQLQCLVGRHRQSCNARLARRRTAPARRNPRVWDPDTIVWVATRLMPARTSEAEEDNTAGRIEDASYVRRHTRKGFNGLQDAEGDVCISRVGCALDQEFGQPTVFAQARSRANAL